MRWIYVSLIILLLSSPVEARRISRPDVHKLPWSEEQTTDLNNTLEDIFNMQKGRYETDIVSTTKSNPNDGEMWITTGIVGAVAITGQIAELNYRANDENFVLHPPVYGEIYVIENGVETAIATQDVNVQFTLFDTNGENQHTRPDHTQDHIEILVAGRYLVVSSITIDSVSGGGGTFEFEIMKNGGSTPLDPLHADRTMAGGGGVTGSASISGITVLAEGDTVELWVKNETGTANLILEDVAMSLIRIGP